MSQGTSRWGKFADRTILSRHPKRLESEAPGDFANVCRQQRLLGERLEPGGFFRRLIAECRLKSSGVREMVLT
jgi:hypothetical protein